MGAPRSLREFEFVKYVHQRDHDDSNGCEVSVKGDAFWSYCGPQLAPQHDELPASFHDWASTALDGTLQPRLYHLLEAINCLLAENGLGHYWLTIRATTPTSEFDAARWHTDEAFFSTQVDSASLLSKVPLLSRRKSVELSHTGTNWKVCATLLGSPTLFIPLEHQRSALECQRLARKNHRKEHLCTSIRCLGCTEVAEAVREDLAVNLQQFGTVQAGSDECYILRLGDEKGAMHSEPPMNNSGRIFVNIIPGHEAELSGLMQKWGMEYPRSWWISQSKCPRR